MTREKAMRHNKGKPPMHFLFTLQPSLFPALLAMDNPRSVSRVDVLFLWSDFVSSSIEYKTSGEVDRSRLDCAVYYSLKYAELALGYPTDGKDILQWTIWGLIAQVYAFGAKKYEKHNWLKGLSVAETLDSAGRHFFKASSSQKLLLNDESNLPDLAHFGWNCLVVWHMCVQYPDKIDL